MLAQARRAIHDDELDISATHTACAAAVVEHFAHIVGVRLVEELRQRLLGVG